MSDPTIDAASDILDTSLRAMRDAISRAAPEGLNERPAGPDSNAIAVLAVHALHSTRWWLSTAVGAALPERDRPSEFLARYDDVGSLLAFFDPMADECRTLLATATAFDAGAIRDRNPEEVVTAAWALLHALEHLQEHVAHVELTLQVFEQRGR